MGLIPRLCELTSPQHAMESSHIACTSAPIGAVYAADDPKGKGRPPFGSESVCTLTLDVNSWLPDGARPHISDATFSALFRPPMWSTKPMLSACLPVHTRPWATYIDRSEACKTHYIAINFKQCLQSWHGLSRRKSNKSEKMFVVS